MARDPRPRWTGTWLGGVRSAGVDLGYPGERLGLPEDGAGSVGGYGRRLGALTIDWLLALLATAVVASAAGWDVQQRNLVTLVVFGLETWLLVGLTGTTAGKRLCGLHVTRPDGRPPGLGWALARSLLVMALVPPLLADRDHRGMHDRAANTIVLRM